ncbi:MAG: hypothetical protein V9E85_13865 [Candidatus Nanopelagicales bacterium]
MSADEATNKPVDQGIEAIDDEALDAVTGGTFVKPVNTTIT